MPHSENSKKSRVLVVDDDEALARSIQDVLVANGMEVVHAIDGLSAKNLITISDFDLVLSDIRMPNLNGIELLHFVRRTKSVPVILMTGFSEILQVKESAELGAAGFLPKPFQSAQLMTLVKSAIRPKVEVLEPENLDDTFSGLRIDEFVSGREIKFDIYVRISESKYVRVAEHGESIDLDRIAKYREKNVTHLYLQKSDFREYLGFTVHLSSKVAASTQLEHGKKLKFLAQSTVGLVKNFFLEEVDKEQINVATEVLLTTIDVIGQDPRVLSIFEILKSHSDAIYAHSVAVSLYSILIAKAVGWNSPRSIMRLAMCGMMHDVGKKEIPAEILTKARPLLTAEEVKILESHPKRGVEILDCIDGLPEEIAVATAQHHENCEGSGYPSHLTKHRLMPMSRILALANEFCNFVFPSPGHAGMSATDAVGLLAGRDRGRFDAEFLVGLQKVCGLVK